MAPSSLSSSYTPILTNEIIRLHRFFVAWFTGNVVLVDNSSSDKSNSTDELGALLAKDCSTYFHQDFHLIPPAGNVVLSKEQLLIGLAKSHDTKKDFDITIRNVQILQQVTTTPNPVFLVSYQEWQRDGQSVTARVSTALLEIITTSSNNNNNNNNKVLWRHVHETWMDGKSPTDIMNKATIAMPTKGQPTPVVVASTPTTEPSLISRRRHLHPQLTHHGATIIRHNNNDNNDNLGCIAGIVLQNVQIMTLQGTIANDAWLTKATDELETLCQYNNPGGTLEQEHQRQQCRRLGLPEMVFDRALVRIILPGTTTSGSATTTTILEWTAMGALKEWAMAHVSIPVGGTNSHMGVSVLKAIDATLWATTTAAATATQETPHRTMTEFHYDWTFSTPLVLTTTGVGTNTNNIDDAFWIPLPTCGMNRAMLQDTSQPILMFDENQLYEDDLHDNGVVSFTIKTRVMPTCIYVLARLWLRVDGVVLRVKETRLMVELLPLTTTPATWNNVYRNVVWRECAWDKLSEHQLPTDVKAWRNEDGVETPAWQGLLNRLPQVPLPESIAPFAKLCLEQSKS
jgi:hypothetical protein